MYDDDGNPMFDEEDEITSELVVAEKSNKETRQVKNTEADYDYARSQIKKTIDKGQIALSDMLALAQSMDHPRAYEVVGQLVKVITDSNKQLMDMHKTAKETLAQSKSGAEKGATNIAFFGSAHDLQKLLNGKTKIENVPIIDVESVEKD